VNGIVTGKQEKQAGSMVFKTSRAISIPTSVGANIDEALTTEEANNSYIKVIGNNNKIAIISLYGLQGNPNYETEYKGLLQFTSRSRNNWPVTFITYQNPTYGDFSLRVSTVPALQCASGFP
jgi:hypothetical protein